MSDHKFTDEEVIKALECCANGECDECPYQDDSPCKEYLNNAALDLINRQRAEIEGLKGVIAAYEDAAREKHGGRGMRFVLNGCDISFTAEAPEDITLKQLLKQCDRIRPDWCACGICSYERAGYRKDEPAEIIIGYDSIEKANDDVSCTIEKGGE